MLDFARTLALSYSSFSRMRPGLLLSSPVRLERRANQRVHKTGMRASPMAGRPGPPARG